MEESTTILSAKKAMHNGEIAKSSIGALGGIITPWDPFQWELEVSFCASHSILNVLRYKETSLEFFVLYIYAK